MDLLSREAEATNNAFARYDDMLTEAFLAYQTELAVVESLLLEKEALQERVSSLLANALPAFTTTASLDVGTCAPSGQRNGSRRW